MRFLALVAFLVIALWAYLELPEHVLGRVTPYGYISETVSFRSAQESPEIAMHRARVRIPELKRIDCTPYPKEPSRSGRKGETDSMAVRLDCVTVFRNGKLITNWDVFPPAYGWSVGRSSENHRAGRAFWIFPIDFPIAQVCLQLLLASALAWTALRGEWSRFLAAARTHWQWMFLPAALTTGYVSLFWLLFGSNPRSWGCFATPFLTNIQWIMPVLVAAVGEELIYRGWGFRLLLRTGWSPGWVLSITSVVFALQHAGSFDTGPFYWSLVTATNYFAAAFAIGLIRAKTGSITMCILAHALGNIVAVASKCSGG